MSASWSSDLGTPPERQREGRRRKKTAKAEATDRGAVAKARLRDAWSAIEKITEVVDGRRRFRDEPPLLIRLDVNADIATRLNALFREYRATLQDDRQELLKRYEIVDMGHKVVGVGSVGLLAFVVLLRGRDEDDLMVLQVKQAQASVLEAYTRKSAFTKHGHRVVTGQRLMQAASDSFLGWIDGPGGRSFYVRQLRDMKWSPDPASLTKDEHLPATRCCAAASLARAHARSGDAIAISAYLGPGKSFDKAIRAFAESYADQTEQDFAAFTGRHRRRPTERPRGRRRSRRNRSSPAICRDPVQAEADSEGHAGGDLTAPAGDAWAFPCVRAPGGSRQAPPGRLQCPPWWPCP